jgi:hypothetical protein
LIRKLYDMRLSRVLYYLPAANCQSRIHKIGKKSVSEFMVYGIRLAPMAEFPFRAGGVSEYPTVSLREG